MCVCVCVCVLCCVCVCVCWMNLLTILSLPKVEANVKAKRDPTRLYQLNESAKNRLKDKSKDESALAGGLYIRAVPHLAVPSWRKGL